MEFVDMGGKTKSIIVQGHECLQCGHVWQPKRKRRPMKCPARRCRNPFYWWRRPSRKKGE